MLDAEWSANGGRSSSCPDYDPLAGCIRGAIIVYVTPEVAGWARGRQHILYRVHAEKQEWGWSRRGRQHSRRG